MVNRPQFQNGGYTVGGKKYKMLVGSRAQVWNGTALKTSYGRAGLKRSDLVMNKWGRIVSKKKHKTPNHTQKYVSSPLDTIAHFLKRNIRILMNFQGEKNFRTKGYQDKTIERYG